MNSDDYFFVERGLILASDSEWERARLRANVIASLVNLKVVTLALADNAAKKLNISRRQVYALINRYRQSHGLVTDMLLKKSHGGKGKGRLPDATDQIIKDVLHTYYLTRQKCSEVVVWKEIIQRCRKLNLLPPAINTVRLRIQWLDACEVVCKREGGNVARSLQSAGGIPPKITAPLEQVQIDHTMIDLMVVDDINRQPIGRPYLTVAIDVFSRSIIGVLVTLEAPSAVSVGLCLAHAVCDKRPWLERLGVEVDWPMSGKPLSLYLDNGMEFKSEALHRGCEQHGISLNYRPPGKTHYGGIVERVIGTLMQKVHELPGTTFSNISQKGDYDSEGKAALTLNELERWLVLAISHYHGTLHQGLKQTPFACWSEGTLCLEKIFTVKNPSAFLIDFLPVLRRKISRSGFLVDYITYYSDVLKSWIANRHKLQKFIIRRNPLDLSRIWVLEPDRNQYVEVPYRIISRPALTLWEHRQTMAQLREKGNTQVNETVLFRKVLEMRKITLSAQATTRKARRNQQRLDQLPKSPITTKKLAPPVELPGDHSSGLAKPFDQIEEW